jgi:hypothetical protein
MKIRTKENEKSNEHLKYYQAAPLNLEGDRSCAGVYNHLSCSKGK